MRKNKILAQLLSISLFFFFMVFFPPSPYYEQRHHPVKTKKRRKPPSTLPTMGGLRLSFSFLSFFFCRAAFSPLSVM